MNPYNNEQVFTSILPLMTCSRWALAKVKVTVHASRHMRQWVWKIYSGFSHKLAKIGIRDFTTRK